MKAFVKTTNGTFPNVNFYLAWQAFNSMGYSVQLFEEEDIDTLDITRDTPVFAGVTTFRKIIESFGIYYPTFDCYPEVLKPYYKRNVYESTLGEVRNKFHVPVFVKPIKTKEFNGVVLNSILNTIPLANNSDDTPVYVSDVVNIVSEYRVYVQDSEILGVKQYWGDWNIIPSKEFVDEVVKNYNPSPCAYGVDIGVTASGESLVIESNDGCNLGNYGLDYMFYGEMILARWIEITTPTQKKLMGNPHCGWIKINTYE